MSLSSSLYTSLSGMTASQTGLTVVSSNMSNANSTGYSRQRVTSSGVYAQTSYSMYNTGSGVKVQNIESINNQFLRENCRTNSTELGYYSTQKSYLYEVEASFGDLYDYNIQTATDELMNAWEELSKNPSDQAARSTVYEKSVAYTDSVSAFNEQIDAIESSAVTSVYDSVDQVNQISSEIADINKRITTYASGEVPLELIDYRENLLDQLSEMVDCKPVYQPNNTVDVISNNGLLVSGQNAQTLVVEKTPPNGLPLVEWESGNAYKNEGGSLGATTALLDPNNSPSFEATRNDFNQASVTLMNEINTLHASATGLSGVTGLDFFVPINDEEPLSVSNVQVNPLLEDVNNIGASTSGEHGDGTIAYKIAGLQQAAIISYDGNFLNIDQFYSAFTQQLGEETQAASFQADNQLELNTQLQAQINAVSSVSTDEELSNMMIYQQAYNANVNVMNIVDELIGDMIQELG